MLPQAEEIRNTDISQDKDTTTTDTLNRSTCDNCGHVMRQGTDQTANQEDDICQDNDRLSSPDITDLAPQGDTGGIRQKI